MSPTEPPSLHIEIKITQKCSLNLFPVGRVKQYQQTHGLSEPMKLLSHFQGYSTSHAVSREEVRPLWLNKLNLRDIIGSHILDPRERRRFTVKSLRLQS